MPGTACVESPDSDKIDNIDNRISNMLNVQRTFTQAFVVDEAGKWYERIARMFCFDLVIHQLSSPTVFPVKARAPSVVALAILFHSHPVLAMQFSTA